MRLRYGSVAAAALCMSFSAALAHHSFAMFDLEKEVTVEALEIITGQKAGTDAQAWKAWRQNQRL